MREKGDGSSGISRHSASQAVMSAWPTLDAVTRT